MAPASRQGGRAVLLSTMGAESAADSEDVYKRQLGLFWLLVRRKIDDFGRDYYVFAANWCGEWAAWGGWFSLIMAGVLCFMLQTQDLLTLENQGALLFVAALFAALLLPSVIWTVIARSATPMRHKKMCIRDRH